ncbi:MAG: hypothetical protein KBI32_11125 [Phycisphaerae bacterium]|nr:hypothetical protein [Phycisphaerae bacterium]HON89981.1 hypothetical protein [Sedimentisphaerales bacterium]
MNRNAVFSAMVCVVLATPVLGVWIYEGTYSYISEPDDDWDPNGTWWCGWDGEGSVSGGPFSLEADGWTLGRCGVYLWPIIHSRPNVGIWVSSYVNAHSSYRWEGNGSRDIDIAISSIIYPSAVTYDGYAVDDTHVSVASCSSGASANGGGGVSGMTFYYSGGSGSGWATTQSGSGASNSWSNVLATTNVVDWGYPPPFLYNVWYEGELRFSGSSNHYYSGEPQADSFTVSVSVSGSCAATGSITINDPNYYHLYLRAEADYYSDATATVDLDGDIQ